MAKEKVSPADIELQDTADPDSREITHNGTRIGTLLLHSPDSPKVSFSTNSSPLLEISVGLMKAIAQKTDQILKKETKRSGRVPIPEGAIEVHAPGRDGRYFVYKSPDKSGFVHLENEAGTQGIVYEVLPDKIIMEVFGNPDSPLGRRYKDTLPRDAEKITRNVYERLVYKAKFRI